jgi:hypothetical protein
MLDSKSTQNHFNTIINSFVNSSTHRQTHTSKIEVWNELANFLQKKKRLKTVNLIMDSIDFQLFGHILASKKDSSWSYKLNGPEQQFQALVDLKRKFQGF